MPDKSLECDRGRAPISTGTSSQQTSINSLVESLGFGPAQLRVMALSSFAMFFCDGLELSLLPLISTSTSASFGLGPYQEALLLTTALFGLLLGNFFSGYLGDTFGRRPAILTSLAATAFFGYASSAVASYSSLIILRCMLGIGMGLGMGPALARVSENCPDSHRIFCQGSRAFGASCAGPLLVVALVALDDPNLQELNWRRIIVVVATLPALFFIAGWLFLRESPVWLACVGQHPAARAGFAEVRDQNSAQGVSVNYEPPLLRTQDQLGTRDQIRIVFSSRLWLMTCSLMFISFYVNMCICGDNYALAHVLPDASYLPAAYQIMVRHSFNLLWIVLAIVLVNSMSRKHASIFAMMSIGLSAFAFAFGGAVDPPRTMGREAVFQLGTNMMSFAMQMLFYPLLQLAVEIYPPNASSTGAAVIMGSGRLGAIVAPLVFERLRILSSWWGTFYIFMGACGVATGSAFAFVPDVTPFRPGESDFRIVGEVRKLEDRSKALKYGATCEAALVEAGAGPKHI